jgi:Lipocalin-like domain
MKVRIALVFAAIMVVTCSVFAQTPKLDGAYKFVSLKFPGGEQTESNAKGMIVVHGKHMAFVRASVDRKTWTQQEPEADRNKKVIEAFNGLSATAGTFEIQGNMIVLNQVAQAQPSSMGKPSKWVFKVDGNKLMLKPEGNQNVEFTFERLP